MEMGKTGICFWMLNVTCLYLTSKRISSTLRQRRRSSSSTLRYRRRRTSQGRSSGWRLKIWSHQDIESSKNSFGVNLEHRPQEGGPGTPTFRDMTGRNKQRELGRSCQWAERRERQWGSGSQAKKVCQEREEQLDRCCRQISWQEHWCSVPGRSVLYVMRKGVSPSPTSLSERSCLLGLPCGPEAKTLCFQCRGPGFNLWLGT